MISSSTIIGEILTYVLAGRAPVFPTLDGVKDVAVEALLVLHESMQHTTWEHLWRTARGLQHHHFGGWSAMLRGA
jgi:hypothetical protein